jgi:hypothetical protein
MKRISVTGADRDPTGAHQLHESQVAKVEGVEEGERIVIFICDEPLECEAVVSRYPGWEPHWFAREDGPWREGDLPNAWKSRREPFPTRWQVAVRQWADLSMEGLLAQNMAADDFLIGLMDGRVVEVHVGYHGDADVTFESVVIYDSLGAWLNDPKE